MDVSPVNGKMEKTGETPVPLFQPLDRDGLISKRRRALPHWEQSGCSYFVTFRLADSPPTSTLASLRDWKAVHSWKSYSARQIAPKLSRPKPLWMSEYFDHIVRSEQQLEHFQNYIRANPTKAHLRNEEYSYRAFH
jgi:hypothetical protein